LIYEASLKFPCHGIGLGGPAPFLKGAGGSGQSPGLEAGGSGQSPGLKRSGFYDGREIFYEIC